MWALIWHLPPDSALFRTVTAEQRATTPGQGVPGPARRMASQDEIKRFFSQYN